MTKYIIKDDDGNYKRICEDVESRDFWINGLFTELEGAIKVNTNPPAIWTTNLNTLKAIDISALSFPMTAYSWVDCLIKNGIQVPSSMEF